MVRTQVQLETRQHTKLKVIAERQSTSVSHLVRHGVDLLIAEEEQQSRWQRLMGAVGSCRDVHRASDVAERHDEYLTEIYSGD